MNERHDIVQIESDSNPGTFYSVNTTLLTCSCPIFSRKLKSLSIDNPHRLCKHLTQAISKIGIPDFLSQYKDEINWFAQQKATFTDKASVRQTKKLALPTGIVQTLSVNKKRKYGYLEGTADEKKISATIPLEGGMVGYTINNLHANYDTITQEGFIPVTYRNMEQAIVSWIVEEYNRMRNKSAPLAIPKDIKYTPIKKELPEDSVTTISIQKKKGLVQFFEIVDNFDEDEYFHLQGQVGRESVEAIIRKNHNVILYNIDGSKVYSLDMAPMKNESIVDLAEFGKATLTVSSDFSDTFPKTYWFIQKAVLKWLRNEFDNIAHA
jgi:hypothetical protein